MHVSIVCGLSFMCISMLVFLPVQGQFVETTNELKNAGIPVAPDCCMTVSKAPIKENVTTCYEQKEKTLLSCPIHAYIFVTESGVYCVDPSAKWLPKRLQKLEKRGIVCRVVGGASNSQA